jgi:hypothetical protein
MVFTAGAKQTTINRGFQELARLVTDGNNEGNGGLHSVLYLLYRV